MEYYGYSRHCVLMALTVILTFCASPSHTHYDATSDVNVDVDALRKNVDAFVGELLRCRRLTAANVAIVRHNVTLYANGYGVTDLAAASNGSNVNSSTLFGIASLSKAFTQALLGIVINLSDKGYTWDTPVRTILGEDFYFYDEVRTREATLRDLLSHRLGFVSFNNIRHQANLDRKTLADKIRFLKPTWGFRSEFKYNNLMYGLLTYITEVIGGDTWENLMKSHVFEPLGMTSSGFTHQIDDLYRPDLVRTYQVDYDDSLRMISPEYHRYWGKIGGSGSIVANADDMSKWVKMHLNYGRNEVGEQVVPSDVIREAQTRHESIPETGSDRKYLQPMVPVSYSHFEYGLAWRIGFYRGWRTVLHTGTSMGYLGQISLVPDLGIGIHSSLSGDDPGHTARRLLHIYIMDLLMEGRSWLNTMSACTFNQTGQYRSAYDEPEASVLMSQAVDDYAPYLGTYGNYAFGNITFYVNDSNGHLMMAYGELGRWELKRKPATAHTFSANGLDHVWIWNLGDVTFSSVGAGGRTNRVEIPRLESVIRPVFVRGLKMSDAPETTYTPCNDRSSADRHHHQITVWAMLTSCLLVLLTCVQ